MYIETAEHFRIVDCIWLATALLHQNYPLADGFTKSQIRDSMAAEGLSQGIRSSTLSAHLHENCIANAPSSNGTPYLTLTETSPGKLRLFRPEDLKHPARVRRGTPAKSVPHWEEIPDQYRHLLHWYEGWITSTSMQI